MATLFNFSSHVKLLVAFDFPSLSSNRADPSSSLRKGLRRVGRSRRDSGSQARYVPPVHRRRQHRLHPVHSPAQLAHLSLLLEEEPIHCLINCPNGAQLGAAAGVRGGITGHGGSVQVQLTVSVGARSGRAGSPLAGLREVGVEMLR